VKINKKYVYIIPFHGINGIINEQPALLANLA
jgi:hypothetical protein